MTDMVSDQFNPFEPGYFDWPYDQFARLRGASLVQHSPFGGWQLYGYDDCFRLLREQGTSVDPASLSNPLLRTDLMEEVAADRGLERRRGGSILMIDPPDHTRLRRLVARVFTPRAIEGLRPMVKALVDQTLAPFGPGEEIDLITSVAFPLPFLVISEMLGIPEGDTVALRDWSHTLAGTLDPILDRAHAERAFDAAAHMSAFLLEVFADKRANPADDLLSALIEQADDGDALTDDELLDQVRLLFIAGHETTVNLIGNGTLALLRNRDQWERLCAEPSLVANAVEECLRYDPPVQMTRRITTAPMTFGDHEIPAGEFVMAMTAAANRDPARWGADAESFRIDRDGASHHLAFGSGIHHCLGAALARMEGQEVLGALASRYPGLDLAGDPVQNNRVVLRGLDDLPVRLA